MLLYQLEIQLAALDGRNKKTKVRWGMMSARWTVLLMISYGWVRCISCTMHSSGLHQVWIRLEGSIEH
jgi:hypothetical protein